MRTPDNQETTPRRKQAPTVRRWSREIKRQVVEATFAPGMSVSIVARRYDINANQLFTWRLKYYRGELGEIGAPRAAEFVPVTVLDQAVAPMKMKQLPSPQLPATKPVATSPERPSRRGRIDLELKSGIKLKLHGDVDAASLKQILSVLREAP